MTGEGLGPAVAASSRMPKMWTLVHAQKNRMVRGYKVKTNWIIKVVTLSWQWRRSSSSQVGPNLQQRGSSKARGVDQVGLQVTVKVLEEHGLQWTRPGSVCLRDKVHRLLPQELWVKGHTPKERVDLEVMQMAQPLEGILA